MKIDKSIILAVLVILHAGCQKKDPVTLPIVSTSTITDITTTTATSGGIITSTGGAPVIENGVCWSKNINPSVSDSKTVDVIGTSQFVSLMTGLTPGEKYHVRAYAGNSAGTAYGADLSFITLGSNPVCTTQPATNILTTQSTLNGIVNANDLSTSVAFEYGITTGYGSTITAYPSTVSGNILTNVSADVGGLNPGTTYHFRVKAINTIGTGLGADFSFTTLGQVPFANTLDASNLFAPYARLNGSANANYLSTTVTFEYGTTTAYGATIAANPNTVTGNTLTNVSADVSGLSAGTVYHFRIKAVNSLGITYGSDLTFLFNSVTDADGNIYKTITIGDQVWMAENLKTTRFNDGNSISLVTDNSTWNNLSTPAYCWYLNDLSNKDTYGALYNWFTVATGKLCPYGWHIPSETEYTIMDSYLGGNNISGGKLKETGTSHWSTPNTGATDEFNFKALPGGNRGDNGSFYYLGLYGIWWTSTNSNSVNSKSYGLSYNSANSNLINHQTSIGFSVRCVKD